MTNDGAILKCFLARVFAGIGEKGVKGERKESFVAQLESFSPNQEVYKENYNFIWLIRKFFPIRKFFKNKYIFFSPIRKFSQSESFIC